MDKAKLAEKNKEKKPTGREMFTVNPDLEADVEDDGGGISIYDTIEYKNRKENEELNKLNDENDNEANIEIDEDLFNEDEIDDLEDELNDLSVND